MRRISTILGGRERFYHLTGFSDLFQKVKSLRECKNEVFQLKTTQGCFFIILAWSQWTYPQAGGK